MPPRKSNVSAVSAAGDEGTPVKESVRDGINVEDLALPRTMVQRLAKGVLPSNTRIEKDAIAAMSKSATVFVNYMSSGANDRTINSSRKTISPDNVLEALADLELAAFLPRVEAELRKFNEIQTGKRNEYRRKLKEGKDTSDGRRGRKSAGAGAGAGTNGLEDDDLGLREEGAGDEGEERAAKRVRRGSEDGGAPQEQWVGKGKGREEGDTGLEEGDTAVDAAIEAVDAAIRAEEEDEDEEEEEEGQEGEDEEEEDDEEETDSASGSQDPLAEKIHVLDARISAMDAGLSSENNSEKGASDEDDDDDDSD
ncbi:MAG: hypothetical protein Q9195_002977 [Heterodermia aff. obscurata]